MTTFIYRWTFHFFGTMGCIRLAKIHHLPSTLVFKIRERLHYTLHPEH
jgi:hypothetical protein